MLLSLKLLATTVDSHYCDNANLDMKSYCRKFKSRHCKGVNYNVRIYSLTQFQQFTSLEHLLKILQPAYSTQEVKTSQKKSYLNYF